MKTKILSLLAVGCLLGLSAWFVVSPGPIRAIDDDVPRGGPKPSSAQTQSSPDKFEAVVHKGLDYLASRQFKDGHWEGDRGNHPVAMTGMAGLAMLMHEKRGSSDLEEAPREGKREDRQSANVRKAADWLMAQSQAGRDGLLFSNHASETSRYMQGHGLATIFLAGACANETDVARSKKMTEVLSRAVRYIVVAQSSQGGWHDTSKVEGHDFANVPATVIQVQALQAAENAGIPVPQDALRDGLEHLKSSLEKRIGPVDMAAALACLGRQGINGNRTNLPQKWFEDCRSRTRKANDLKLGSDELAHYYWAQVEHNLGSDFWNVYRTAMFDRIREAQNQDGSWPAGDGLCVGKVYSAAVWCTVLQLDNNSHPSKQAIVQVFN